MKLLLLDSLLIDNFKSLIIFPKLHLVATYQDKVGLQEKVSGVLSSTKYQEKKFYQEKSKRQSEWVED